MRDDTVLNAIDQLNRVATRQQLAEWAKAHLLADRGASSVLICSGKIQPEYSLTPYFVSASFPDALMKVFSMEDNYLAAPLLRESQAERAPVMCALDGGGASDALWQTMFRQKGFSTVLAATHAEPRDGCMTYLCLTDPAVDGASPACHHVHRHLSIVTPILHSVLSRLVMDERRQRKSDPINVLTPREREILEWIRMGKTNAEISCILGVAFSTTKNHVQRILIKLQVNNRTQAISKCSH